MQTRNYLHIHSDYLWLLTLTYSMVIVFANWFDARLISGFGLVTDAGTLIFPLTFLTADLITEVYGYQYARRAIWLGFLFNIIFILYGQLVVHLPNPPFATQNAIFNQLITINTRIIIASLLSYFIAEPINALLLAKLKIKMQGKKMGLRFMLSTTIAAGLDSFVFGILAFYQLLTIPQLFTLILTIWLVKVVVEFLGLPLSIKLAKKLKQIEHLDIYDNQTRFNLFSLETNYHNEANRYGVHHD